MPKRSATPATVRSLLLESDTVMDLRVDGRGLTLTLLAAVGWLDDVSTVRRHRRAPRRTVVASRCPRTASPQVVESRPRVDIRRSTSATDDARPNSRRRRATQALGPFRLVRSWPPSRIPSPRARTEPASRRPRHRTAPGRRRPAALPRRVRRTRSGPATSRTGSSRTPPRRRRGSSTPTARSCTSSTPPPTSSTSPTRRASRTRRPGTGSGSSGCRSAPACSARRSPSGGWSSPRTTATTPSVPHAAGPGPVRRRGRPAFAGRRAARGRDGGLRRPGHVLPPAGRVHGSPDRARPLARRSTRRSRWPTRG